VTVVRAAPGSYKAWLAGATGRERHPDLAWTATAYVCHHLWDIGRIIRASGVT
jgi:hypothetical protein